MAIQKITPIILAGGFGTRLWPISTRDCPKQFVRLLGNKTLFQETILRAKNILDTNAPIIICNQLHGDLVGQQLASIDTSDVFIIEEPIGRNTAPAIGLAAMHLQKRGDDELMLVLPSDHVFKDVKSFYDALVFARFHALQQELVCFAIKPNRPETGFGYIEFAKNIDSKKALHVVRFIEKPNLQKAQEYIASKKFYWNSGMFMFTASSYLLALKQFAPDIFLSCELALLNSQFKYIPRAESKQFNNKVLKISESLFAACRSSSIDCAIMEKATNVVAVPLDAGWSDLGSWTALNDYII